MKNYSRQREQILDVVKKSYEHPAAEEVYEIVHKNDKKISKSTVYRNLNELAEDGKIIKISTLANGYRFDYMKSKHHHAVCNECGKVFDFEYNLDMKDIQNELKKQVPFDTILNCITVVGTCNECKNKK